MSSSKPEVAKAPSIDASSPSSHEPHQSPASVDQRPDVAEVLARAEGASRRRRWPIFVLGGALGAAAALGVMSYLDRQRNTEAAETEVVELATAPVEQRDLVEEIEWSGTLGYGESVAVGGAGGIVTSATAIGTILERGDVMATVDDHPVVVFFGDTPMWRDLSTGDEGRDVLQLETNLAALGYDPDQTVDIDLEFTSNTALMVERWQEDLGVEMTGDVGLGSISIAGGPSSVVSITPVGSAASGQLASLAPRRAVTDLVASVDGVITDLLPVGETIEHATVLYVVDGIPVVALTETDAVSAVLLSSTYTGLELEEALAAEGHDPQDEMTVDGTITAATNAAVERWQSAVGLPVTGRAEPGYYVPMPTGRAVEAHLVANDESVVDGGPILSASTSELSVGVVVEVGDADEFEVGQSVSVQLADESIVDGLVSDVGAVIRPADPQATPTVEIRIAVLASGDQALIEGPVTVLSIGEAIEGATVVPTRALVALVEGGFAVEKVNVDGSSSLVGVELGTFDDGVVEVVAGDVAPGDEVIVPQ